MTSIPAGIFNNYPNATQPDPSKRPLFKGDEFSDTAYQQRVGGQEKKHGEEKIAVFPGREAEKSSAFAQLQKTKQSGTLFDAQKIAQEPAQVNAPEDAGSAAASDDSASDAVNKFLDYMSKTPEERYYEALLAEMGLTKEQLQALPPEERAKIEAEIQEKMQKRTALKIGEDDDKNSPI
ncbi:MAG: hypothetical protein HOM25_01225 [Rhodospirillaceae bacterium]|jgi:hypothetical protein|nr:hypothetical protein [Rhodospirillaceae bacterium]MBT5666768.1 hypothetical protein [Rhodospirillaceae bacterium]MBT5812100.1 hypothetical protein [Rhodospirillaceae bacterium]